jgi:hypothetical protein
MTNTTAPVITAPETKTTADTQASSKSRPAGKRRMAREPKNSANNTNDTDKPGKATKPNSLVATKEPRGESKIAKVVALLEREEGATLAVMVEATGWQPHTTRAALTGLKKKGRSITRGKRGDVTCYHIQKAL